MTYALNNYDRMVRVINSFPRTPITDVSKNTMTHFMTMRNDLLPDHMLFSIQNVTINPAQNFMLDKIFLEDDIEVLDFRDRNPTILAVVSGANRIARKTCRGKGNIYCAFEDHVLVWYQGKSNFDAPAQLLGNNIAYHENYKDYFIRVRCNVLTDEDHANLEKLGYVRV